MAGTIEIAVAWSLTHRGSQMTPDQGALCVQVGPPPSAEGGWLTLRGPDAATPVRSVTVRPDGWVVAVGLAPGEYRVSGAISDTVGESVVVAPGHCTYGAFSAAARPFSRLDGSHPVRQPTWTTANTVAWTDLPGRCVPVLRLRRRGEPTLRWEAGPDGFGVDRRVVRD